MKKLLLLFLMSVIPSCNGVDRLLGHRDRTNHNELILLIAGQSNGTSPANNHPPHYSSTGKVYVEDFYNDHGKGAHHLVLPTEENPVRSNISWIYLGDRLVKEMGFEKVTIANRGMPGKNSTYIKDRIGLIQTATREYPWFDFMLWIQGESDYHDMMTTQETYENMRFIMTRIPGRWFVAEVTTRDQSNDKPYLGSINRVLNAQRAIIRDGFAEQGPDLMPLKESNVFADTDGGEFEGLRLKKHADMCFDILIQHIHVKHPK